MKTCITLALLGLVALAGCGGATTDDGAGASASDFSVTSSFTARGTGYYPDSSALEGGFVDRAGKPLHTLQQYLAGSAPYASVAMDSKAFSYGTRLRIHELETKYGRSIIFRVVDTGGAFVGKGRTRIDICTASNKASLDPTINGTLHIDVINEAGGSSDDSTTTNDTGSGSTGDDSDTPTTSSSSSSGSSGTPCSGDGTCNPGNDGSGMICSAGFCVSGCHTNAQCPGNTTCQSGQCQ